MQENTSRPDTGLCARCTHERIVETTRGSTFTLCELSSTDARFPKYPRLPVLACDGFEERNNSSTSISGSSS